MLRPGEVIHDGGWAQVGRLLDDTGQPFIRKVGKYLLDGDGLAVLDFLAALEAEPHPNLLAPLAFSGAPGAVLVEDYPDLSGRRRLDQIAFELRNGLSRGDLALERVLDLVVRIAGAAAHVHRLGFVHQDVRPTNVFVHEDDGRLVPTLFDYTFVVRPFFLVEGRLFANLETPPEARVGYVSLDARYDVYQLGWLLRSLTHYEAGMDIWRPLTALPEGLGEVIACALGPLPDRFPDGGAVVEALSMRP
jgi:hypothetical protein